VCRAKIPIAWSAPSEGWRFSQQDLAAHCRLGSGGYYSACSMSRILEQDTGFFDIGQDQHAVFPAPLACSDRWRRWS